MRIVFFGSSKFILPIITVLKEEFDLALVVTTETNPTDAVPSYCSFAHIDCISIKRFDKQSLEKISSIKADVGVLGYFGIILPEEVLKIFPHGIINSHPSLLPLYRGPTPIQTAILNGDTQSGVTIIKLDEQTDHGPILTQKEEPILPEDTAENLYHRYNITGANLIATVLPAYISEKLKPTEQDHQKATFTPKLSRKDGYIDAHNPPSKEQIDRMIRAYYPWPGAWVKLKIKDEISKIVKLLPNKMVQLEGKNPVDIETFTRAYPQSGNIIKNLLK